MNEPPLHTLGLHANQVARCTENQRMQAILQWVGVGSVIMMGLGAGAHLLKDVLRAFKEPAHAEREPYPRHKLKEKLEHLDRHYRKREGESPSR